MRKKMAKSKFDTCMYVWKKRIASEKSISEKCAESIAQRCLELIERMSYGNAMIAFRKQDGTFCLEQGTLVGYEKEFHHEYSVTVQQLSIVYWSSEQKAWRRFMISNLLAWRPIV